MVLFFRKLQGSIEILGVQNDAAERQRKRVPENANAPSELTNRGPLVRHNNRARGINSAVESPAQVRESFQSLEIRGPCSSNDVFQ